MGSNPFPWMDARRGCVLNKQTANKVKSQKNGKQLFDPNAFAFWLIPYLSKIILTPRGLFTHPHWSLWRAGYWHRNDLFCTLCILPSNCIKHVRLSGWSLILFQEETENETRQKMNQFFAKVEHTKTCQTSTPRWRCTSGVDSSARKAERKIAVEQGKSSRGQERKERGYRRAKPWPTQVWT